MMIGKFVGHYKILEKLGEGGMGVVYKAEDTKLNRTVALKFLPPELIKDSQAKARFIQEAQAAAALDHPNICAVFEIGEAEGMTYIAMPYVGGQRLKEKIAAGPLFIEEALDIAGQVGEGLKEAHEKGIIHRDIKPGNIMLTEKGQAKILDFGLAKLTAVADVTKTLTVMGTIAYMSPEQARGEAVDHRTDIWSFGATLYEMLTGQMPFGPKHDQALIYSILNDTPEPLSRLRKDIPRPVEQLVLKTLEKDKLRRYQNMAELLTDLKAARISGISLPKAEKSIIVLPFENISPDPEQEYFCDGMTEEIITDLSHVHDLLVISRSSAMTFKGTKKKIKEIAHEVNVQYVLEGSVRKAGNNLRITAQLIDARNDAHLWAEKYNGTLDDVFAMQEKISRKIVDVLKMKLSHEEESRIADRPIENVHAYECYLRAKKEFWSWSEDGLGRALKEIQRGLKIIGKNELLYATEGSIYLRYAFMAVDKEKYIEKMEEHVNKIFELNPNSLYGHFLSALVQYQRRNMQKAVKHLKQTIAMDPQNPDALFWLVYFYATSGKNSEAKPLAEKLIEIDPLTPLNHMMPGWLAELEGRFDISLEYKRKFYEMEPENPWNRRIYAWILSYNKRFDEAFLIIDLIIKDTPQSLYAWQGLFLKYALRGEKEKAIELVTAEREKIAVDETAFFMAECYALIDEKEKALEWLEIAVNCGYINYPFLNEFDPFFSNIHGEPRFQKLMERVKFEWEHFEA